MKVTGSYNRCSCNCWHLANHKSVTMTGFVKKGRSSQWNVPNKRVHLIKESMVDVSMVDQGAELRNHTVLGWWHGALRVSLAKKWCCRGSIASVSAKLKDCQAEQISCGRYTHKSCLLRSPIEDLSSGKSVSGRASIPLWRPTKAARFVQAG